MFHDAPMNNYRFEELGGILPSGSEFSYSLVEQLARSVDAHCAWIAEFISASEPTLRTIAVSIGGRDAANFEYPIAGTPAEEVFDNAGICFFLNGVQERFPDDRILRDCDAG